jgi:galactose mutarotase-like enzyme
LLTVIHLEAEGIALTIMPERGGKITSLVDTDRGREWLEQADDALVGPADVEKSFDEGDMSGWDEMMPTISACWYPGATLELPDHGELWRVPWEVTRQSSRSVSTRVNGHVLPYLFERTLTLDNRRVRVEYRVSTSDDDLRFLWAAHPLFALQPETKVVVDNGSSSFEQVHDDGARTSETWPDSGVVIADVADAGQGQKFFTRALSEIVVASLTDPDGTQLTLDWRGSQIPWTGLWLDNCSLSRRPVAAIEPTSAPDDSLEAASSAGQSWTVSSGLAKHWSFELSVSDSRAS